MSGKYITDDPEISNSLSRTACAIMLLLYFHTDDHNMVNKKRFMNKSGLDMDMRTWNKYWAELEAKSVLVKASIKLWMLSPDQCYAEGVSQKALTAEWKQLLIR
tara:strand:- start:1287 stop:1598 length:312 start_codon:yes stop_codon:yes gene_type:complete